MRKKELSTIWITKRAKGRGIKPFSVTKKMLVGTIGLSLLQAPILVSAANSGGVSGSITVTSAPTQVAGSAQQGLNPADAKITKAEAETRVRALFPVLNDANLDGVTYGEQNVYPQNTKKVWVLNWSVTQGNSKSSFSTEVDALTGDILNYFYPVDMNNQDTNDSYYPPKVSEDEARNIAEKFIPKASPSSKSADLKPSSQISSFGNKTLFGPVQYSFYYDVLINSIPSDNEYISITIDGKGEIIRFNRNRSQGEYPTTTGLVSQAKVEQQLKNGLSVSLAYIPSNQYSKTDKKEWKLGYVPDQTLNVINAKTGKNIDLLSGNDIESNEPAKFTSLVPSKQVFTPHQGNQLTADEAVKLLSQIAPNSSDYNVQSNLNSSFYNGAPQVWNLNWNKRNSMGFGDSKSAAIDANTGQLLNYYEYSYPVMEEDTKKVVPPTINESVARNKAIDLVQSFYPNAAQVLKLSSAPAVVKSSTKTSYQFSFQRFYKGLPVQNDSVTISLDGSGKLLSYSATSSLTKSDENALNALTATVKKEDALQTFITGLGTELRYMSSGGYVEGGYVEPKVLLGYVPTYNGERYFPYVNAITGKTESYSEGIGVNPAVQKDLPSDAVSHAASKDLATLLEYQVITPSKDGLLHPDAELTLGDWLMMMLNGIYAGSDYYRDSNQKPLYTDVPADSPYASAVQLFADRGWFKEVKSVELHPEQKLTREMLAKSLTAILHYNQLAEFLQSDTETLSFADAASIKDKGSVALVIKLGLMKASDGRFEPAKAVTKAEAASTLVLLARMQGKVDTPIR